MEVVALGPENFWTKRTTKDVLKRKNELVQLLSFYHNQALAKRAAIGDGSFHISLLSLRSMVRDYQPAFNFFFEVVQKGYKFSNDSKELTLVVPKIYDFEILSNYCFEPEERPECDIISKVYVKNDVTLISDVTREGLFHLLPKIQFLMSGPGEFNFMFVPSGDLEQRDTSIWPIPGIETWPGWVRQRLFGGGVDIRAAYVQFVVQSLKKQYGHRAKILFNKVFQLWEEPSLIRNNVASILGVDYNNFKKEIKGLLMAIAMGSKVSPTMVYHDISFSRCSTLINRIQPGVTEPQAAEICNLLSPIGAQFKYAKTVVDTSMSTYLKWERHHRYILWEICERHGIMMHDGIDGIPDDLLDELMNMDLGFDISRS